MLPLRCSCLENVHFPFSLVFWTFCKNEKILGNIQVRVAELLMGQINSEEGKSKSISFQGFVTGNLYFYSEVVIKSCHAGRSK